MTGGEALLGIRMEHARYGKPAFLESVHSGRGEPVLLAAAE
jgi:hypothetical protein